MKKQPNIKVEIELTHTEVVYLTTCSIQRVTTSAIDAVPEEYEYMDDLCELGDIMEPLRYKLANAIFEAKAKAK